MIPIRRFVAIGSLLVVASACSGETAQPTLESFTPSPVPSDWVTFTAETRFQLSLPPDWVVQQEFDNEAFTATVESLEANPDAGFPSTNEVFAAGLPSGVGPTLIVGLLTTTIPSDVSAYEALREILVAVGSVGEDFEMSALDTTHAGDHEAALAHFSFVLPDSSTTEGGRWWSVVMLTTVDSVGWMLTCGVWGADASDAEEGIKVCETTVLSLRPIGR